MATSIIKQNNFNNFGTILWTNPSPSDTFVEQTVDNVDCSKYEFFLVEYRCTKSSTARVTEVVRKTFRIRTTLLVNNVLKTRDVEVKNNSVYFTYGQTYSTLGSGTQDNDALVPIRVYGLK